MKLIKKTTKKKQKKPKMSEKRKDYKKNDEKRGAFQKREDKMYLVKKVLIKLKEKFVQISKQCAHVTKLINKNFKFNN